MKTYLFENLGEFLNVASSSDIGIWRKMTWDLGNQVDVLSNIWSGDAF